MWEFCASSGFADINNNEDQTNNSKDSTYTLLVLPSIVILVVGETLFLRGFRLFGHDSLTYVYYMNE